MSRRARRWRRRLLAAALLPVAAVVAAQFLAVRHPAVVGAPAPAARPVPSASASTAAVPAVPVPRLPRTDLAGLRWSSYHGVELPSSSQAGPRRVSRGLASGFADTPLGALLAAVNIAVRANPQWGPGVFVPTITGQVAGPDAAALLAACQAAYGQAAQAAGVTGGRPIGSAYVTEQAFRWVGYTPSDATIDLVSAGPGSQGATIRAVTRVEVTWDSRDWQVTAPPGGDWSNAASLLTSLSGYTFFPGQG